MNRVPKTRCLNPDSANVRAVLFDMDGTLIRSHYDWPAIRAELGVEGPSIIDALNALPDSVRCESWARLRSIERQATDAAELVDGVRELLRFLAESGIKTALVTNNSLENTEAIIDRFQLSFDVVLTRDSGLFKPSGAPLVEAMKLLGVSGEETVAVGDSHYDLKAARQAGCAQVIIVNGGFDRCGKHADQAFENLGALIQFFRAIIPAS